MVKDGDIEPLAPPVNPYGEIRFHIFNRNAVLVKQRAGDALAHLFFGRVLQMCGTGDEVEDIAISNRGIVSLDSRIVGKSSSCDCEAVLGIVFSLQRANLL